MTKVSSDVSTTEYTAFDILGRVTAAKQTTVGGDPLGYTTGYTYNLSGALIEETYPSGRKVKNVLDNDGELSLVQSARCGVVNGVTATCSDPQGYFSYAKSFTYNAAGAVTSMQLGNGRWETTQFNSRLQPTQIGLGTVQNATDKLKLDYEYGAAGVNNGNVTKQTITVSGLAQPFVQNYLYDELNRLKSATETNDGAQTWTHVYGFDRYGNRNITSGTGVTNLTFNGSNNRITTSGYSYDNAGNTVADPSGKTYTYDAENKQTMVSNGSIGQYFYDGDGKRVKKYVPGTGETTIFVYDAAGKQIAEYSTLVAASQDAKVAYLTTDHLGSPRINTDQYGTVIARHDYHPFGEEIFTAQRTTGLDYSADSVRKQFTGYERDDETDLDFAQARYFKSHNGRFTTVDPIFFQRDMVVDPQRFNLYVYARNNPLKWIDPFGEQVKVAQGSSLIELYELVGGQENFNQYFQVGENGLVSLRSGVDISNANQGAQFLNQLIGREQTFLVYLGADADAVAKMFAGTTNSDGSLNKKGKEIRDRFQADGSIVGTSTRPLAEQPNGDIFAVIAINPATFNYIQIGVGPYDVGTDTLQGGVGQRVRAVSMLIHELAENLDFSMNGTGAGHPAPDKKLFEKKATRALYQEQYNLYVGAVDYKRAHNSAIRREIQIRHDLSTINGGFAGGRLRKQ